MDAEPKPVTTASHCPSMGLLFDFVAGEIHESQVELLTAHIAACADCRDVVARLEVESLALSPKSLAAMAGRKAGQTSGVDGFQSGQDHQVAPASGESWDRESLREALRDRLLGEADSGAGTTRVQALSDDLDGACDAFEQEWIAGRRPQIEQFLSESSLVEQDGLLYELVRLDVHYRFQSGDQPHKAEYIARFPEHSATLDSIDFANDSGSVDAPEEVQPNSDTAEFGAQPQQTVRHEPEAVRYLGEFALLERIGSGGFGTVWRARDAKLNRIVAVKVPSKEALDPAEVERFLNEAKAAARLKHPNIVAVHAVNADPPAPYIVTDYVPGVSLREWLNSRRMSFQEAAYCCAKLGHALHHAHERGIVHRDIKPENVLVDASLEPHVADFGLAKQDHATALPETVGAVFGTPAYMSPEQARGEGAWATRSTDIYSLGALLYALLTGRPPFLGNTSREILKQVLHDEPRFPPQDPQDTELERPVDLEVICLKAMSKLPSNRYVTAEEFALDLERFLRHEPIRARKINVLQRGKYWIRRNRLLSAALAGVFLLALTLGLRPRAPYVKPTLARPRVLVSTNPAGATLAIVPLGEDGSPDPNRILNPASKSPVEVDLEPGDYLVVAAIEGHGFHEVYRHVPRDGEMPYMFRHHRFQYNSQGVIQWPAVTILAEKHVIKGMAKFDTSRTPDEGSPQSKRPPSFYLDTTEFTIADLRNFSFNSKLNLPVQLRDHPPADNVAASWLSYFEAMTLAEGMGKRLPEEREYQFASSSGGKHQFPWGDGWKPELASSRTATIVDASTFDKIEISNQPSVLGLYSNVAEWTSTGPSKPTGLELNREVDVRSVGNGLPRKVWDWSRSSASRKLSDANVPEIARARIINSKTIQADLGFRCARSVAPRLRREDFAVERVRPVVTAVSRTSKYGQNDR